MYEVHHRFEDLEEGTVLLWNGSKHTVTKKTDGHINIDGKHMMEKDAANELFADEDFPFEILK